MAHQWKAGDLAVCVDVSGTPRTRSDIPAQKAVYRVSEVFQHWSGVIGLRLVGLTLRYGDAGYAASRFRPVLPAEPVFTEAMRSLKPRVEA